MLSRRSFLQLVGASFAATALRPTSSLLAAVHQEIYQGRALTALPIFATRSAVAVPTAHLWPDSITSILDYDDVWYQVPGGWVRREGLQPMLSYNTSEYRFIEAAPFWAEVAAPVAPVRAFCAADAPLVTRIGHGGVSHVIDVLPGEPKGWYGIANQNGELLGWTQGVFWRPVEVNMLHEDDHTLHLDHKHGLMTAYDGKKSVLQAPFSRGLGLQMGSFMTRRGAIGGIQGQDNKVYEGVAWQTLFGDRLTIAGVYWHNRFGQAVNSGPQIQVTPLLARWLYGWLNEDSHIVIE